MRIVGVVVACLLASSVARADETDLGERVEAVIDSGDSWRVAIPKVAALLGTPAIATDDRIEWAMMDKQMCAHVVVTADADGFVQRVNTQEMALDTEDAPACKKLLGKKAKIPAKLRGPSPLDADAEAATVVQQFGTGKFGDLFDAAHPGFRNDAGSPQQLARLAKMFEMRAGKFVKAGPPSDHAFKDSAWVVYLPVVYDKGTLQAAISFVPLKGKPVLVDFNLKLPKELQAHPDPKDAARAARADLDLLLAAKTDAFFGQMHRELAAKLSRENLDPQLAALLKQLGAIKSVKQTAQKACDDRQCFEYEVKAANGTTKATMDMTFFIGDWVIYGFNLDPPQ
jgi:hypothetical protein